MLCAVAGGSFCAAALAEPGAATPPLDPVVVTATRTPFKVSDVVAEVTVLDRATLERNEGRTLVEALAQAPGLQFTANGGLGKSASLFVRGLEARHVLLLVDGVRVGSATLNTASFDNLPLDLVERIEIVRGPMSSLYGSNAMGGVVQVFTRRGAAGLHGNARASVGSEHYGLASTGLSWGADRFDLAAQVQHQRTDGFSATNASAQFGNFDPDEDGFRQNAGSLRAGWTLAPGWRAEALWLESTGKTQYDDGPGADARAALRNRVQSLQLSGAPTERWHTRLAYGRALDRYDTLASASPFAALGAIETRQTQLDWENRVALPLGEALVVLERIEQDVSRPGAPYAVSDRRIDALALGWTAQVGAHDVQASLRRDRNSQFGGKTTGALGYAWRLSEAWRAGGSYGSSFTAPSFNQLYYPGFGNPALQPEEGRHGELFAQWSAGVHRVRATAYQHRYDLFISSGPQPVNVPKVEIDGATLAWEARYDALALSASYDHVDPRNRTAGSAQFDKLLPRRAQQAAKAGVDWTQGPWTLGASVQAYAHRYDNTANTLRLGGYGVLDLRADWALHRDWRLGLRLNNAGGKDYQTAYGYKQPGRDGYVTLRWSPR
ncbi:MAG TPA: TonB-dependent receptor [Methylibium sp.]|nr:TonB-dependent receptor [Methylibium sp.]